ncbi:hypothetical protein A3Q56_05932 [Intoshia linei]|uniref:Uncharacterized protein n=1 Tax=Intoshia linei TaxID=1819745 RepID=A0A177AXW5_9BILA|nr:hypothetical protein A3Q56_05932 [Intoshia linei]
MNCTSLTKSNSQTSDTSCSIEKYETASKSLNKTIRIDKRQSTLSSSNQDELSNVINVVHGNVQSNDYKTKNFLNRFDSTYTNQESNRSNCQDIKINTDIPIQNIENTQNFEPTPKKIQKSTISSIMPDSVNVPEPSYEIDEYKNKKGKHKNNQFLTHFNTPESSGNGKTPVKTNQKHMNQNIKKPKSEFKNAKNSKDRVTTLNPNFTSEISLCIKYFLFAFNTIFFISGIFLFVVLVILIVKRDILSDLYDVSQFNSASFIKFDPLVLIIFICLFIVIIAFAGCIGALRENIFFLNMYSISLVSILVVFIIMSFIPIVFKNSVISKILNLNKV